MFFADDSSVPDVELRFAKGASATTVSATLLWTSKDGQPNTRTANVEVAEVKALARWVKKFWEPVPPALLSALGFELRYSHREHIGEGFYDVRIDGITVRSMYEQLGGTNTFRAERIESELAKALAS